MDFRNILTAAAVAACLFAAPARADEPVAPDAETIADVHCVMVSFNMLGVKDAAAQVSGMMSTLYWLGRLDDRAPALDLEATMIAEYPKMKEEDYRAEAVRCGTFLQARGKFLTDMGHDMQDKGKQMLQEQELSLTPASPGASRTRRHSDARHPQKAGGGFAFRPVLQDRQMAVPASGNAERKGAIRNLAMGEGEADLIAFFGQLELNLRGFAGARLGTEGKGQQVRRLIFQQAVVRRMAMRIDLFHPFGRRRLMGRQFAMLEAHLETLAGF